MTGSRTAGTATTRGGAPPAERVRSRVRYALVTLGLGLACESLHLFVGQCARGRSWHEVTLPIDAHIAVLPGAVWVYNLWGAFLLLPIAVGAEAHRVHRYLVAAVGSCLSAYVVFLAFPVHVEKAMLGDGISARVLGAVYATDTMHGGSYLPSLHVATAWLAAAGTLRQGLSRLAEALVLALAVAITVSTLLTKQHVVADVAAGLVWAPVWWWLAGKAYPWLSGGESDPVAASRVLVRRGGRVAIGGIVRCILFPAAAWWLAGCVAPDAVAPVPGLVVAAAGAFLVAVAASTPLRRAATRLARDVGLALAFAGVAVGEGYVRRATVGGAAYLLALTALTALPGLRSKG